ncbi:hypothetical protein F4V58_10775 [Corynebacterium phocae]|nr:hypothetical protein F4V58_10775 [Corynebacterium phocae]
MEARYKRASLALTSNFPPGDFDKILPTSLVTSLVNRRMYTPTQSQPKACRFDTNKRKPAQV